MKRRGWLTLLACSAVACSPEPEARPSESPFHFGVALEGSPSTAEIQEWATRHELTPHWVVIFQAWPERTTDFVSPAPVVAAIVAAGAIPVLTWEPFFFQEGKKDPVRIPAEEILDGHWNAYIDRYLKEAAAAGPEVWIRFAHEMNTDHYHWGFARREDFDATAPVLYRRMFRHVVGRARALELSSLRWVFCPNAESVPPVRWNQAHRYYPGSAWVDILGMDGYNWGTTRDTPAWRTRWMSFAEIFGPLEQELRRLGPKKPLVVFETASATEGGDKVAWMRDAVAQARRWGLTGVIWFDVKKEADWRLLHGVSQEETAVWGEAARSIP